MSVSIPMNISVVIPAHNEEATIGKCLAVLLKPEIANFLDTIVVCNGCQDNTAAVAKRFPVSVVETEIPSKINALNLGDSKARFFPRFYLDGDIEVSGKDLLAVAENMEKEGFLAGTPAIRVETFGAPFHIKAYYDIWTRTPYCKVGLLGSGVYGMSKQGRARFKEFPKIIADDNFVRLNFSGAERYVDNDYFFSVKAPRTISALVNTKARARLGDYQLRNTFPELMVNETNHHGWWKTVILPEPGLWAKFIIYSFIKLLIILKTKQKIARNEYDVWDVDKTIRQ